MTDAEITVAAVRARKWEVVRLRPRDKIPAGDKWDITSNADVVASWIAEGFNIGLLCGPRSGVAVLDPDKVEWADMIDADALGKPCLPWVITGSGRLHYYVAWTPNLPAKLEWKGEVIGEIQRGGSPGGREVLQQVVLPPSIHPVTGARYRWIAEGLLPTTLCLPIDPVTEPLPKLPFIWVCYLQHDEFMRQTLKEQRDRGY
jgi:hypothetical protein